MRYDELSANLFVKKIANRHRNFYYLLFCDHLIAQLSLFIRQSSYHSWVVFRIGDFITALNAHAPKRFEMLFVFSIKISLFDISLADWNQHASVRCIDRLYAVCSCGRCVHTTLSTVCIYGDLRKSFVYTYLLLRGSTGEGFNHSFKLNTVESTENFHCIRFSEKPKKFTKNANVQWNNFVSFDPVDGRWCSFICPNASKIRRKRTEELSSRVSACDAFRNGWRRSVASIIYYGYSMY